MISGLPAVGVATDRGRAGHLSSRPPWPPEDFDVACFLVRGRLGIAVAVVMALATAATAVELPAAPSAEDAEFFEARVRPLLLEHCSACHSRAAGEPEGDLSFDTRAETLGHEGLATPGKPELSLLVEVVRYDGKLQMPPDGRLPPEAIATIEEWVRRGLPWPVEDAVTAGPGGFDLAARRADHWCWQAPERHAAPSVAMPEWCRGEIDQFVLARLEAADLTPVPEASRAQLVRRAAEILTGLPADPADVDRVVADPDPLAYEKYVDGLLASPHFGERFARHWLDVVRYGETRGHEFDFPIPNAWRYRDWVIDSFNADLPYDQFVREQISGDLLETPRLNAAGADLSVIGTGFWYLGEEIHSPVDIAQDAADRTDNRVDTFGKAFLGMALGCARCHDHKFDAISKEDYYAIAGTLGSSSYRQVPFESIGTNRDVARRLEVHDTEARRRLGRAAADTLAGGESLTADDLGRLAARLTATLPPREAILALESGGVEGEIVIADYSRPEGATALIGDGFAWGLRPRPAGDATIVVGPDGAPARLRLEPTTSAHFDSLWAGLTSSGEREAGALGGVDRAGRVLRTPKLRIEGGTVWHRVRGHLQIFTCVDSHVLLVGPLYGSTLQTVDTQGEWKWIRQDLGSDLNWQRGHLVHVEYVPVAGAADVAEVVVAPTEPKRADPFLAALARRLSGTAADDAAIAAAVRELVAEALAAARDGTLSTGPRAAEFATVLERLLADPGIDWSGSLATAVVAQARELESARATITASAKLASATAPAILDGNGVDHPVLVKGSAARPASIVPRRFLEAVDGGGQPDWPAASSGRRELADRVLDPANPLTARVAVNRFWHHLFGRGLIPTPDNFGKLGEPYADAGALALLDTLAVRFREEGWSMKRLVREIVTSSTWRMQSVADPRAVERDPRNLLLHHFPLRRLEGEAVRDKILAVSGRLDPKVGGPPVEVALSDFHEGRGKPGSGPLDGDGRRSIYTRIRRNFLPAIPVAFDMPVPFQAMGRRNVTNVPAQALTLMNDPFVVEQSARWAGRILAEASITADDGIVRMYREAFARSPSPDELAAVRGFLVAQTALHGGDFTTDPRQPAAWADLAHAFINAKEFIFVP